MGLAEGTVFLEEGTAYKGLEIGRNLECWWSWWEASEAGALGQGKGMT